MRFAFSDEHDELRAAVRTLLQRRGNPTARPPHAADPGYDAELWRQLTAEIDAAGLALPEHCGGSGCGMVEAGVVLEELGRMLTDTPFLGSAIIGAEMLLALDDHAANARLLPEVATGQRILALAWSEPEHSWQPDRCSTTARPDPNHAAEHPWLLDGHKVHVLDGAQAQSVLVVARTDTGLSVFELSEQAIAESCVAAATMDTTRRLAEFTLRSAPARLLQGRTQVEAALTRVLDVAAAALATEQIGAAQRWLDEIVSYTKARYQFGRPIGSFQALKHRLADLYVTVQAARSLCYGANWAVATGAEPASQWAAMAKSACCEAYEQVAAEGVQMHGGIGITWEHEAHLHVKRAHSGTRLFGTPRRHRERLAL